MAEFTTMIADPARDFHRGVLVEASAGTGKTYNIQNVFLRLVVTAGLPVSAILVVTFTDAATQELRERLRRILNDCYRFLTNTADETIIARLAPIINLPLSGDQPDDADKEVTQRQRIKRALMDFDSAAIFTIHGFCNRVLERYAFECGGDPDAELLAEASELLTDICRDWWRRNTYKDAPAQNNPFAKFDDLCNAVKAAAAHPDALLQPSLPPDACATRTKEFGEALRSDHSDFPQAVVSNEKTIEFETTIQTTAGKLAQEEMSIALAAEFFAAIPKDKTTAKWKKIKRADTDINARLPQSAPLLNRLEEALYAAQTAIVAELRQKINGALLDRGAITYDAMLSRLRDALQDEATGPALKAVLRTEFQAALIDEFQDTDPIQYDIFKNLFLDDNAQAPFLLVGDPKQSIYSFRSGDIFTYFGAADHMADHATLATNYRSEKQMVAAVNEFFADTRETRAFRNQHIAFTPVQANGVKPAHELRRAAGDTDPAPMKICCYANEKDSIPGRESPLARQIYQDVAAEIVTLLDQKQGTRLVGRPLSAQDIAILVCDHPEAKLIGAELAARGVPFTRQANSSIFDSPLATKFALLVNAMLAPGDIAAIRSVLGCGFLPCPLDQLLPTSDAPRLPSTASTDEAPQTLEAWVALFREAHDIWQRYTFIEAFQHVELRCGIYAHLAAVGSVSPAADIATLRHLVDTCHVTATEARLSPAALARWLLRQLDKEQREDKDAYRERPSSDDAAVRIMTIFTAKGLEFPIVFVPTLWRRSATPKQSSPPFAAYHDHDKKLILDIAKGDTAEANSQAERLQENIRLTYVALTRAINRTYLFVVTTPDARHSIGDEEEYALAYLYNRWHSVTGSAIEKLSAPPAAATTRFAPDLTTPVHPYDNGHAIVDKRYGHTSFSALTTGQSVTPAQARDIDSTDAETAAPDTETAVTDDIFLFPGGAHTGDCWHAIFEALDFRATPPLLRATTDNIADSFAICDAATPELANRKREALHQMVAHVLNTPLPAADTPIYLRDIAHRSRRSELSFHFPLRRDGTDTTLAQIGEALDTHWHTAARDTDLINTLRTATRTLPRGFLTGSIDLLFQHQGRFYIIDWKSNRLDGLPTNFNPPGLKREMAAHSYYLQYLLYTVAVDRFLRQSLQDYHYEKHFGGIFYLFLRGLDGQSPRGIFHDRPCFETIAALATLIAPSP